jgi:hypothetical protein
MTPTVGRIVHYCMNEYDADHANRRRTDSGQIAKAAKNLHWPPGAQAHIGNPVRAGDVLPMIIVKVNPAPSMTAMESVNGQVFLDGCDVLWVTSRQQIVSDSTDKQGLWFEPPRASEFKAPTVKADEDGLPAKKLPPEVK